LAQHGLRVVETPALGDCQFIALPFSAGIPVDHVAFRAQVTDYMRQLAPLFEGSIEQRFKSYDAYVNHMARQESWGDHMTLQVAACLMMRPINVVTDHPDEAHAIQTFEPPGFIHESIWGPPVYIAFVGYNHYEATEPQPVYVKPELN